MWVEVGVASNTELIESMDGPWWGGGGEGGRRRVINNIINVRSRLERHNHFGSDGF